MTDYVTFCFFWLLMYVGISLFLRMVSVDLVLQT